MRGQRAERGGEKEKGAEKKKPKGKRAGEKRQRVSGQEKEGRSKRARGRLVWPAPSDFVYGLWQPDTWPPEAELYQIIGGHKQITGLSERRPV